MRVGLVFGGDLFWAQIKRLDNRIASVELLNVSSEQILITL